MVFINTIYILNEVIAGKNFLIISSNNLYVKMNNCL